MHRERGGQLAKDLAFSPQWEQLEGWLTKYEFET